MEKIKRTTASIVILYTLTILYPLCIGLGFLFFRPLLDIWFSLFLFFVGSYMITQGMFFNRDSSYLVSLICLFSALAGVIVYAFGLQSLSPIIYFSLISVAMFIVYLIFRQIIHLKTFAIFCFEVLLLIVKEVLHLNNLVFWIVQSGYLVLLVAIFIIYLFKTKERKSGI